MIGEGLISSQLKMKRTNKPGWKLLKFAAEKRKVRYTVFTLQKVEFDCPGERSPE